MSDINSTKQCCTCKNIKPSSEFYKRSSRKDGLQSACKDCNKNYGDLYQKTDIYKRARENYQKSEAGKLAGAKAVAKYQKTDAGKAAQAKSHAKYRTNNPIKTKAQHTASNAIPSGRLIKPDTCEECPNTGRIEGHHDDYSVPLVVRWLCRSCHDAWHAENGPGLNG